MVEYHGVPRHALPQPMRVVYAGDRLTMKYIKHHLGVRLVSDPTLLAHRVSGSMPKAFRDPFKGDVPRSGDACVERVGR